MSHAMKRRWRTLFLLPLLGTAALLAALTPASASAAGTGTISGTITDAVTGADLSGAFVLVFGDNAAAGDLYSGTTAANGQYSITGVAPGTYFLDVIPIGSVNASNMPYLSQWYGAASGTYASDYDESSGSPVDVSSGATATANQGLVTAGVITGTVTDESTGDPLDGAVDVYGPAGNFINSTVSSATTGKYTLSGLPTGKYYLYFKGTGTHDAWADDTTSAAVADADAWYAGSSLAESEQTGTAISVSAGTNAPVATSAALPAAATITGTVTDSNGNPVPEATVQLYDAAGNLLADNSTSSYPQGSTETAADGTYAFYGMLASTYEVEFLPGYSGSGLISSSGSGALAFQFYDNAATFTQSTPVTLTAGLNTPNINASLGLGGVITGTVTGQNGIGESGVSVELLNAAGQVLEATTAGNDGTYTFTGVPAGSYYVEFIPQGVSGLSLPAASQIIYSGGSLTLAGASAVKVGAGTTTSGVNASLQPITTPAQTTTVTTPGATVTTTAPTVTTPASATAAAPTTTTTAPTAIPAAALVLRPTVSYARLAGVAAQKATLSFRLTQGQNASKLTSFRLTLPKGFAFVPSALKRGLAVSQKFSDKLEAGALVVTMASPQRYFAVALKAGAISVTKAVARQVQRRRLASEVIDLVLTSSSDTVTTLPATVKLTS